MKKSPMRVVIHPLDSQRFVGYIYLGDGERLQDLLNDERFFIPVHVVTECTADAPLEDVSFKLIFMQKSCISIVEEASTM